MYSYIKGTIEEIEEGSVVIENNGIGYNILMPMAKAFILGSIGDEVKVYTYTNVKEDTFSLFGFVNKDELKLFKMLISVSGVGPKTGQEIISNIDLNNLINAIVNGDFKTIAGAPGVGKKTAERIIIDLKDKVSAFSGVSANENIKSSSPIFGEEYDNAVLGLISLGYSKKDSQAAAEKAMNNGAVKSDEILMGALKIL